MKAHSIPLRVVLYKDDGDWIAHCLKIDVYGDGPSKEQALASMATAVQIQIEQSTEHRNPKDLCPL
jgi:hypothetical protein